MAAIEIAATYDSERFRFSNSDGDVVIASATLLDGDRPETVNGGAIGLVGPDGDFDVGATYRFYGRWDKYRNKRTGETEDQFKFQTSVPAQPHGRTGVIRYIASAGAGCHVGIVKAEKLWEAWGSDAVRMLREEPVKAVANIPRFTADQAEAVSAVLWEKYHTENCSIELMNLLDRRGFPKTTMKRCLRIWGNSATEVLKRDPYKLMRFRGCGFLLTDKMYMDLGLDPARMKRQALAAWYKLRSDTNGHTWFREEFAVHGVKSFIGTKALPAEAIRMAERARVINRVYCGDGRFVDGDGVAWVALGNRAANERYVAQRIVDAGGEPVAWPGLDEIGEFQPKITDHQLSQLQIATTGTIGVFGGSPGTGKSFCAAGVIAAVIDEFGRDSVACAAPTGKAAVRMTEALNANGIRMTAKTIHSLLKVDSAEDGWSFVHREGNPLPFRFLVIDETSMVDTDLMSSLFAARGAGTHILFVGDVNQLPPVGHGAPLRDMIAAGVPYGELREIQRNSGRIVQACAQMRDGEKFGTSKEIDIDSGENLFCTGNHDNESVLMSLEGLLTGMREIGFDPVWETQVVVPVNKKSELSRHALNDILQQQLNSEPGMQGQPFRVNDKVINTKNGWYSIVEVDEGDPNLDMNDKGEAYVANGEIGKVIQVEKSYFIAQLDSPSRTVRVPRGSQRDRAEDGNQDDSAEPSTGCSWDLGYAISVHKSQGAEWPVVLVILDEYPGAKMVCDRSWVYTAVSRAKKLCILLGKMDTAHRFCRKTKIYDRQTFLTETIKHEQSMRLLAEI